MPKFHDRIDIAAASQKVWAVWSDVRRWHEWTASISSIEPLLAGPVQVGSRVRIQQPRLRPNLWTVTEWLPEQGFVWEARVPGLFMRGSHRLLDHDGGCTAELGLAFEGLLSRPVAWWGGRLIVEYMRLEAEGLKRRSEAPLDGPRDR